MNNRCDLCRHWDYVFPEDMGICKRISGPVGGIGFSVPIARAAIDRSRKQANPGTMATSCDTRCDGWMDGRAK